jgi:hypothetical protein
VGIILVGAPHTHFFSFSFLTQVKGFFHLETMASSSHASSFVGDSSNIQDQLILVIYPQVMMR